MSEKYPGGVIRSTPVTPSGPYQDSTAPGVWTLDQATNYIRQGIWPTAGNVNPSAFIENLFQTWLYTGDGSTQTITNGIDLAGQGGLVWIKSRSTATDNALFDTARGASNGFLSSNTTDTPYASPSSDLTSFGASGFSITNSTGNVNVASRTYASWTFREQPKFFDVVTWTGNGTSGRSLPHNLGSVPGCVIIKRTSATSDWLVWHRSLSGTYPSSVNYLRLNLTSAQDTASQPFTQAPSSTDLTLSASVSANGNGATYVAYLFAHDAGGFGLTGTDNVISCGSYTTDGSGNATVSLGYEPQWIMIKGSDNTAGWSMWDTMRGLPVGGPDAYLFANSSAAEATFNNVDINATGFNAVGWGSSSTYIYIAIRRGPMKTPTSGTSVFDPEAYSGTGTSTIQTLTTNFPVDAYIQTSRQDGTTNRRFGSRLTGQEKYLLTDLTAAEQTIGSGNGVNNTVGFASNTGIGVQGDWNNPSSPAYSPYIMWNFRRAPGFFDVVCYTGNNVYQQAQTHNLGVAPELIIVKRRNATANWAVGCNFTNTEFQYLNLNSGADGGNTNAYTTGGFFGGRPTATTFILAQNSTTNASGGTYVAYLFATLAGVSKVGTYTGTGALQTINCGFTSGARFVLIKRLGDNVDPGTGDWYVYDSARGISSGNDPYLFLNSTAAEVTGTNYVDTTSVGFQVTAAAPAGLNANGGTYIFLAIA